MCDSALHCWYLPFLDLLSIVIVPVVPFEYHFFTIFVVFSTWFLESHFLKQDKLLKNKTWVLEDETGKSQYQGQPEEQSAAYYILMREGKEISAIPAGSWYVMY